MAFRQKHLLGIEPLHPEEIKTVLDVAERYVDLNRQSQKHSDALRGLTQINMFFENSTRTQSSFELAGKRLGADVMNMAMQASSIKKGETEKITMLSSGTSLSSSTKIAPRCLSPSTTKRLCTTSWRT